MAAQISREADVRRPCLLIIHGAWHHAGMLEPVAGELRRRGYDVHVPPVAGHIPGLAPDPDLTLADMVESIRIYVEEHDLTDFVAYGHSSGGVILTQLAPRIRPRLRRLVFHNAFILDHDNRIYDESPPIFEVEFNRIKDRGTNSVALPFALWREAMIQDADLDEAKSAYDQLLPEPAATFETSVDQRDFFDIMASHHIPTSYMYATGDIGMPAGHLSNLNGRQPVDGWAWHPRFARKLGIPRVIEIPQGSHEIALTNPALLAAKIHQAARD